MSRTIRSPRTSRSLRSTCSPAAAMRGMVRRLQRESTSTMALRPICNSPLVVPLAYENPLGTSSVTGSATSNSLPSIASCIKPIGWDVAVFPRYILPSASSQVGEQHSSIVLPIWLEKDWDTWSTFGGGGCVIQHGSDLKNFCLAGWALTRTVGSRLQIGLELVYRSADTTRRARINGDGCRRALRHQHALSLPGLRGPDAAKCC